MVLVGYRAPEQFAVISNANIANVDAHVTSVDEVIATSIAAGAARTANLYVAPNVSNLAVSTSIDSDIAQTDGTSLEKPQILQLSGTSRNITTHTVVAGESVDSLSVKYGVSKDTIKWANNLRSDSLSEGTNLKILPVDGVLHTVNSSDTVVSIASKYKADATRIVLFNDLEASSLVSGSSIIIPDGVLPSYERPDYVAPVQQSTYNNSSFSDVKYLYTEYNNNTSFGNTGIKGQCTWYVWERRLELGYRMPAGAVLGNAQSWDYSLGTLYGYSMKRGVPSVGSIIQDESGPYGHIGIVESINAAGDLTVTDMNYISPFVVSQRTVSAAQAANYDFIN